MSEQSHALMSSCKVADFDKVWILLIDFRKSP